MNAAGVFQNLNYPPIGFRDGIYRSRSQVTTWLTQNYEPAKIGICRGV